jgi:hypothetical protein
VQLMKRIVGAGLGTMGAVALTTAIWPTVASLMTGLLVTVLCASVGTLVVLGARRLRGELMWRHELLTMPPVDAATDGAAPTLTELRESA